MKRAFFLASAAGLSLLILFVGSARLWAYNPSPYGINTHIPSSSVQDKVVEAHIAWIRVDFNWLDIEPEQDRFNWGYLDSMVANARNRGLAIYATLAYSPAWASGGKDHTYPPDNVADWQDFVRRTVARYKSSIQHWGMWNEPNLDGFFSGTAEDYRDKILKPGYQAAKEADAGCYVIGPELAHMVSGDSKWFLWMNTIFSDGGADSIDIVSHHIYKGDVNELYRNLETTDGGYPSVLSMLERFGLDDKEFWLTETGWTTDDPGDGDTPETQADRYDQFLHMMLAESRKIKIAKVFFYEIIDDPNYSKFGIVDPNFSNKPAFEVYQRFIEQNPNGEPIADSNPCGLVPAMPAQKLRLGLCLLLGSLIGLISLCPRRGSFR